MTRLLHWATAPLRAWLARQDEALGYTALDDLDPKTRWYGREDSEESKG